MRSCIAGCSVHGVTVRLCDGSAWLALMYVGDQAAVCGAEQAYRVPAEHAEQGFREVSPVVHRVEHMLPCTGRGDRDGLQGADRIPEEHPGRARGEGGRLQPPRRLALRACDLQVWLVCLPGAHHEEPGQHLMSTALQSVLVLATC